jgi:hypothetical protein
LAISKKRWQYVWSSSKAKINFACLAIFKKRWQYVWSSSKAKINLGEDPIEY